MFGKELEEKHFPNILLSQNSFYHEIIILLWGLTLTPNCNVRGHNFQKFLDFKFFSTLSPGGWNNFLGPSTVVKTDTEKIIKPWFFS